jgi:hypothetical protein
LRGDETKFVKLVSTLNSAGKKVVAFSFESSYYEAENTVGDTLWLKMVRINHSITGYFSGNGTNWTQVGQAFDVSVIDSYSDFSSFTGTLQGLYVQGATSAYFDLYVYRDAYTPILAECPANQFGTTKGSVSSGISALDNIHNNDWALYAGVEFGNSDYKAEPDSVEFTASSIASGGTIQVWLDSIATGTKVAECTIGNTGSWSTFKKFKASVNSISGSHDVYLRFVGPETSKLFQLKWINFSKKFGPVTSSSQMLKSGKLLIYPNPARNWLTVSSGFQFSKIEIFSLNGRKVFQDKQEPAQFAMLNFNLNRGMYLLRVIGGDNAETSKFLID